MEVCMCSSGAAHARTEVASNIRWACNAIRMASLRQGRAVQACGTLTGVCSCVRPTCKVRGGAATPQFASC